MNPVAGLLEEIEVRRIRPPKRMLRTDLGSLDELVASIVEKGLLQPIVVRPALRGYEVVAGNRRFEACKRLGWSMIPCQVVELDDKEAFEVALVENVQRQTINPVEEARAYRRYVNEYGYGGVSDLARKIGKSEQYVSQRLQLLQLPEEILRQVTARVVTPSHARELTGINLQTQKEVLRIVEEERCSSREVRKVLKIVKEIQSKGPEPFAIHSYSEEEKRLNDVERTLTRCIVALKMALIRYDQALGHLSENEWVIQESLMQSRTLMHKQIDRLLRLKKRLRYNLPVIERIQRGKLPSGRSPAVGASAGQS